MADEIGRAFQRVGGSAGALGLDFDKVSSWIATISSRTREGAETIGNAVKSILARMQSLKENGFVEEDGTKVNQVAKALNQAGIALMDQQGQFRDFGKVMDELGAKWDSLDNRTKSYISTVLAGTFQQSRFANLMEGYSDSVKLYEQSLNSAGTAQQKYNLWLEGTEAHLNKLKNVGTGIWQQTFDSQGLRTAIDGLTSLVQAISWVIEKFGFVPTILFTVSAAFSLMGKNIFAFLIPSFTALKVSIASNIIGFNMMVSTSGVLGATLSTLGVLIKGVTASLLTLGRALVIPAIVSAVAMGIGTLIGKYQEHKQAQQEAEQQNQKMAQTYMKQGDEIDKLVNKYSELDKATQNGTVFADSSQQQEYYKVSSQLAQLLPTLTSYVDENGQAHLKHAQAVRESVDAVKELSKAEASNILNSSKDEYDKFNKDLKQKKYQIFENNEKMSLASGFQNIFGKSIAGIIYPDSFKQQIEGETKGLEAQLKMSKDKIQGFVRDIAQSFNTANDIKLDKNTQNIFDQIISGLDTSKLNNYTKIQQTAQSISKAFGSLKDSLGQDGKLTQEAVDKLKKSLSGVDGIDPSVFSALAQAIEKTVAAQKEHVLTLDELQQKIDGLVGKDGSLDLLNKAEAEITDEHKLSQDTLDKLIDKYGDFISTTDLVNSKMLGYIKTKKNEETSFIETEYNKTQVFIEESLKRLEQLKSEIQAYEDAIDKYNAIDPASEDALRAERNYLRHNQSVSELDNAIKQAQDKLTYLNKSAENVAQNTYLKSKEATDAYKQSIDELDLALERLKYQLDQYPKSSQAYRDGLQKEIDLIQQKINKTNEFMKTNDKATKSTVTVSPSGFATGVNPYAEQQATQYGLTKTSGYRTPDESVAVGGYRNDDHTKGIAEDFAGAVDKMDEFAKWATSSGLFSKVLWQGKDQISGADVAGHFDHVHVSWKQDQQSVPIGLSKEDFDNINKAQEDVLKYQEEITKLKEEIVNSKIAEFENQLQQLDVRLKISDSVMGELNKSSAQYRDEITLQIDILKQKQKAVSAEADTIRNSGVNTDELTNKVGQLSTAWWDFQRQIDQLNLAKVESQLSALDEKLSDVDAELKISDVYLNRYDKTSKEYRDELIKQIALLKQKQIMVNQEIDIIKKSGITTDEMKDKLKQLTSTWWDYESNIENINKQISDIANSVADEVIDTYKQIYEKQRDAELDALDKRNKAEQQRHDNEMKRLDDEMSKFEESINLKQKEIDQQQQQDDYNKQLAKAQQERADIQKQIDVLSLDNSIEAKAKREDLTKQLSEKDQEINDMKTNRERDLRKQNLQDQLDAYKKDIDAKKEAEDEKYKSAQEASDKEREAIQRKYDNMLNDERFFAKLRKDILEGNFNDINKDFANFAKFLQDHAALIGESITTNLLDKIKELKVELANLSGIQTSGGGNPFGMSPEDYAKYLANKKDYGSQSPEEQQRRNKENQALRDKYGVQQDNYSYEDLVNLTNPPSSQMPSGSSTGLSAQDKAKLEKEMADNSAKWWTVNAEDKKKLEQRNQEIGTILKKKYDPSTGIWTYDTGGFDGGKAPSKIGEILNKLFNDRPDRRLVSSLLGEMRIPPKNLSNITDTMKMMISSITPTVQVAGGGGNTYQVNLYVDNLNGTKKDAEFILDKVLTGMKSKGKKI